MNKSYIQQKNILLGIPIKTASILLNFALVPLLINLLGKSSYGVWITVFSVTNWILTFDLGIGQGLRNRLTEALSEDNYENASTVISSAFFAITIFSVIIFFLGTILVFSLNFQELLNFQYNSNEFLRKFVFISLYFTALNFILSLYKKMYLSIHKSYLVELINLVFLSIYVGFVFFWNYLNLKSDVINLTYVYGGLNFFISLVALILFLRLNKKIKISFKKIKRSGLKSLFGLSIKFFVINICLLIILSTDNLIISNLLGPDKVTDYYTVQRIFHLLPVFFALILTSSWSLYSASIIKRDYDWISNNLSRMKKYLFGLFILGLFLYLFKDKILNLWVGKDVITQPKYLAIGFLVYSLIFCYTNIYNFFINASNNINLQMYLYMVGAFINIPLSIFFVKIFQSSTGVILATIISITPLLVAMPIQSKRIIQELKSKK